MNKQAECIKEVNELKAKTQVLHTREEIEAAIARVAEEMNEELKDLAPVFMCVMNGAVVFMGQLITKLNFPLQINYIHATRYRGEIEGSELFWQAEPSVDVNGRNVVIVEDILDTGLTLAAVIEYCKDKGADQIYTATLVDKKRPREESGLENCDFTGLYVEDRFLLGYGMDYKEYLRNEDAILAVVED
jgi:hypoxanthine phosphoribosyltransferase